MENKGDNLKNRGLFLMLLLPVSFVIWYITETMFIVAGIGTPCRLDEIEHMVHCNGEGTLIYTIAKIINKILVILIYTGVVGLIPGIIMYIKGKKKIKTSK